MLNKIGYIVVAIIFGVFGIHNFFEKKWTSGFAKLIITVCSWFLLSGVFYYIVSSFVSLWILFDILNFCLKKTVK